MAVAPHRYRFSVDEYYRMAEAGILGEDDRVELIEGEIIQMASIGSHHAGSVKKLIRLFTSGLHDRAVVSVQDPIRIDQHNEPQPDLALLRPREDFYTSRHPLPDDVLLVVEVADTIASYDRLVKAPLYARAGIPEYWLVDLESRRVEVYRAPSADGYQEVEQVSPGRSLAPEQFPDLVIAASDLLPPAPA